MLADDFQKAGNWLFRWRSYLPLALFLLAIPAARDHALRGGAYPDRAAWEVVCLAVACLGLAVRILTVGFVPAGTSGRNTLKQTAASLNATGMYSLVRHPIYLGNFLMWFGLSLLPRCWWFTVITVLAFWLYYERIMFAEEGFLFSQFGDQYREWTRRHPGLYPQVGQLGEARPAVFPEVGDCPGILHLFHHHHPVHGDERHDKLVFPGHPGAGRFHGQSVFPGPVDLCGSAIGQETDGPVADRGEMKLWEW